MECAPDCIIGDKRKHSGTYYTNGAWCMNKDLVQRITALLKDKTDEELGWLATDDVSFHQAVIINAIGTEATDSEKIYSRLSWGRGQSELKRMKYRMERDEFAEKISPLLAMHDIELGPKL